MKRLLVALCLTFTAAAFVLAQNEKAKQGRTYVFFGFLLGSPRIAGVAFDLGAPDKSGNRLLRAYVCDGLGVPDGIALWFKDPAVVPSSVSSANPLTMTAVGGSQTLRITAITERGVHGSFTEGATTSPFVSYPAIDGAGIYQVTLDANLHYTGTSTDGAILDAQAAVDGTTTGTIKPADGPRLSFRSKSLALAPLVDLTAHGLPTTFPDYVDDNQIPGSYVAVIAPGGSHWFGRSGFVTIGSPGLQIIGLDKKDVTATTTTFVIR
jgi:hypothetical protein